MNNNSRRQQYSNYSGFLTPQHQQQQQFINNPPLEVTNRYQTSNFNGRNIVHTQGQTTSINTAPVPGAPAARFDGNVPFHNTNNQGWLPNPHMMTTQMVAGQPQIQQRQFMYHQAAGQHPTPGYPQTYATVPNMHYQMQIPRPPTQAPTQATTFPSGMPQSYQSVPLPAHAPHLQPHVPQMSNPRQVQMNPIQNPQIIPGSQTPQSQFTSNVPSMNVLSSHHQGQQNATHFQKRVPKPLAVIDPKTKKEVDLKVSGSQSGETEGGDLEEVAVNDVDSKSAEESSVSETGLDTQKSETENFREGTLNPAADSFFPVSADLSNQTTVSKSPETETTSVLDAPVAEVDNPEDEAKPIEDVEAAAEPMVPEPDIVKDTTPEVMAQPTGSQVTETSDVQPMDVETNAADETVSDKAVVEEQILVETEQVPVSAEPSNQDKAVTENSHDESDIVNGDGTDKPSENEAPSQDEDERVSGASSPPSYNFKIDSSEAPATTELRKLHYDRDYLIKLQRCHAALKQPKGLPEELIEQGVILKEANPLDLSKPLPALKSKDMNDFTPDYARLSNQYRSNRYPRDGQRSQGGGSGGSGGQNRYNNAPSNQRRGSQQSTRRIEASHRQPVKIHQAENAYVPAVFRRKNINTDEESDEARLERETTARMRVCFSLLNKLTPQNSDTIFGQIKESGIIYNTNGIHDMAVSIFKKAITEPPYSVALADLVSNIMAEFETDSNNDYRSYFKTTLLTQCQQMFETDLEVQVNEEEERMKKKMDDEKDAKIKMMLSEEIEEAKLKVRSKYYGNIKFVGELYLRGFLGAKTIHNCIALLLQLKNEESIESVCKFLETTGEKLDQGPAVKRLDAYFQRIVVIKDRIESQRLKFKLEDLIDMRSRKWKLRERAAEYQVRPRTRAELERERIEEENKKQAAVDKMYARKREEGRYGNRVSSGYGNRPSGVPSGQSLNSRRSLQPEQSNQQKTNDGWTLAPSRRVDTRSLVIKSDNVESDMKLGPSSGRMWSQGCRAKSGRETGGDRVTATKSLGRQGLSPSPRNSANSSRRGSNSNIPASISSGSSTTNQSGAREIASDRVGDHPQNGGSDVPNSATIEKPPLTSKMRQTVENKSQHIFSEYAAHKEFDAHAFDSIKPYVDTFIDSLIQHVLEKSKTVRIEAGKMLCMMVQSEQYLRIDDVVEGIKPTLEAAADMLMDVPKFYSYIAEFLSGCICDEIMAVLPNIMASLEEKEVRANVVCEMLHFASEIHGHDKVGTMFRTAGLDWYMFLPSQSQNYENFVKTNKLEFTLTGGVLKVPDSSVSLGDIEVQLHELISDADLNLEAIFSLFESVDKHTFNSSDFVCMAFRTIAEESMKRNDFERLQNCSNVLQYIIQSDNDRMMTALYGIQQLTPHFSNKPSLIDSVLQVLSESSVITDEVFLEYYNLEKPKISEGYNETMTAAAKFFAMIMTMTR